MTIDCASVASQPANYTKKWHPVAIFVQHSDGMDGALDQYRIRTQEETLVFQTVVDLRYIGNSALAVAAVTILWNPFTTNQYRNIALHNPNWFDALSCEYYTVCQLVISTC